MKTTDRIEDSKAWKIFSKPGMTSFVCALASMVFSEDFMDYLVSKNWVMLIFWVACTWFGFFLFWSIVVGAYSAFIGSREKLEQKMGRLFFVVPGLFSVLVFAIIFYGVRFVWLK